MKKCLFIANTVFQVLAAMWIKEKFFGQDACDIIVSNHMNGGREIAERLRQTGAFDNCCYAETLEYCRYRTEEKDVSHMAKLSYEKRRLNELSGAGFGGALKKYDVLLCANVDRFFTLVFDVLVHKNKNLDVQLFEDGLSTYSALFEQYCGFSKAPEHDLMHRLVYKYLYCERYAYDYFSRLYLFSPDFLIWKPDFQIVEVPKITDGDDGFREMCNYVFQYDTTDSYDRKYIFMEEAYFADNNPVNDVELVEKIAERVGRENIMIKIHPRNPINRFGELGYKTNTNTAIPWEVILMNLENASEKILITVASSSVLTPYILFGKKLRTYSIYDLIDKKLLEGTILSGELGRCVLATFEKCGNFITVCKSVDEVE